MICRSILVIIRHLSGRKRLGRSPGLARHEIPGHALSLWRHLARRLRLQRLRLLPLRRRLWPKHPAHAARHGARGHACRAQRPQARRPRHLRLSRHLHPRRHRFRQRPVRSCHASRLAASGLAAGRRLLPRPLPDGGEGWRRGNRSGEGCLRRFRRPHPGNSAAAPASRSCYNWEWYHPRGYSREGRAGSTQRLDASGMSRWRAIAESHFP